MFNVVLNDQMINLDPCHRCSGLMVSELVGETNCVERRCVICGERVDPVILAHRRQRAARAEAEKLFSAAASLN
ncbi:MAG: hypothetical protein AB1411_14975 [Nitrospirota bacterium]